MKEHDIERLIELRDWLQQSFGRAMLNGLPISDKIEALDRAIEELQK